jgi:phosphate transport system substrate-binding protein
MRILKFALAMILALGIPSGCSRDQSSSRTIIQNKGSDTLVNVAQAWAEAYKEVDPSVAVAVSGGGSGTGISALINGTVDIANASRQMKPEEIHMAEANGIEPKQYIVGYDALAVYVHPDNPIQSITLEQLAGIYGEGGDIDKWSQLGITIPGGHDEIVRLSRQNNSGTFVYFREVVLGENRDYKLGSRDLHGSKDVVETVANTPSAIGYSGLAYATDHVKMVPIIDANGNAIAPSIETAVDRTYPIARPLFMYTAGEPTGKEKAYMDWILSPAGQKVILDKGYAPAKPTS